jgi:microcompartment protein CcmL/EutN
MLHSVSLSEYVEQAMNAKLFVSVHVTPEVHDVIETVLLEGESVSRFVEQAILRKVVDRRRQSNFVARGIASREEARRNANYIPADEMLARLSRKLDTAKAQRETN